MYSLYIKIENHAENWLSGQNNTCLAAFTFLTLELKPSIKDLARRHKKGGNKEES